MKVTSKVLNYFHLMIEFHGLLWGVDRPGQPMAVRQMIGQTQTIVSHVRLLSIKKMLIYDKYFFITMENTNMNRKIVCNVLQFNCSLDRLLQNTNFPNFCVGEIGEIGSSEYCMYACGQIYFPPGL